MIFALMILFASFILTGCGNQIAAFHQAVRSGNLEEAEAMLAEEPIGIEFARMSSNCFAGTGVSISKTNRRRVDGSQ